MKVCHCRSESAQLLLLVCHRLQELLILLLEGTHRVLLGVGEQMSGMVQPDVGLSDRRPEMLRRPVALPGGSADWWCCGSDTRTR
ncbi:MAG TPA: hypothetical protein VGT44_16535 [Ktedonobacteraceae bacterium]|nr:hypothetical protein [Ktedonobacteraceae bacterium]